MATRSADPQFMTAVRPSMQKFHGTGAVVDDGICSCMSITLVGSNAVFGGHPAPLRRVREQHRVRARGGDGFEVGVVVVVLRREGNADGGRRDCRSRQHETEPLHAVRGRVVGHLGRSVVELERDSRTPGSGRGRRHPRGAHLAPGVRELVGGRRRHRGAVLPPRSAQSLYSNHEPWMPTELLPGATNPLASGMIGTPGQAPAVTPASGLPPPEVPPAAGVHPAGPARGRAARACRGAAAPQRAPGGRACSARTRGHTAAPERSTGRWIPAGSDSAGTTAAGTARAATRRGPPGSGLSARARPRTSAPARPRAGGGLRRCTVQRQHSETDAGTEKQRERKAIKCGDGCRRGGVSSLNQSSAGVRNRFTGARRSGRSWR